MAKKIVKPAGKRQQIPATPATARERRPGNAHFAWISGGLAAVAFLLYLNTLGHQYVLDDPLAIGKNDLVKQGIAGIPDLFAHHYRAGTEGAGASALLYRPLSLVTFAIEWSLAPGSPGLGHFMNALWYALTVGLLFAALRRCFRGYHWLWAAGAALLFAVHPLHTEVVANIKSRDEILNLFFSAAALYGWARWLEKPSAAMAGIALGAYFLALLSKESAITLLPVFSLVSWFFFDKTARQSGGHALLFAVPAVVFLLVRAVVLGQTADQFEVSEMDNPIVAAQGFAERSATSFMVLWKYFQLLVFPHPLLSDYSYRHLPVVGWAHWQALAGLAWYGGLAFFAVRGLLRRQAVAFCLAAFLCGIALYSQLPLVIGTLLGERLMYAPSLWFCAAAVFGIWQLSGLDLRGQTAFIPPTTKIWLGAAILTLITIAFGWKTITRNPDWKTNLTLFEADVAKAPNSVRLHNGVGTELYLQVVQENEMPPAEKENLIRQIETHARAAIAIRPNPVSFLNLGNAAISKNQYAEAIGHYEEVLRLAPNYGLARINIGRTYQAWGRMEGKQNNNLPRAAELLEKAIAYGNSDATVYLDLGTAYGMMGRNEQAIPHFEKAAQLEPKNPNAWRNLAIAYRAIGNAQKAEECLQKAKGQ
ncbi:MAG: tetratricopeptide repeat protein [Saprospirales bacterium]|nr:tetratricopeptide repeat protein [Saprospirales bacterium]